MDTEPQSLREAFVEAFPLYVATLLVERGVEVDEVIADAIVEGVSVLDDLLANLEETPYPMQRQSPLELFRESLRPVGRALDTAGVPPPESVATSTSLVAWDIHMLSPASPALLGTVAHEAHLRWGVSKAKAMALSSNRRPTLAVFCSDAERQVVVDQASNAGYSVTDDIDAASFALVDADAAGSSSEITDVLAAGCRTVAFGSQIDDIYAMALRARGVWRVASRDSVVSDLAAVLPAIA